MIGSRQVQQILELGRKRSGLASHVCREEGIITSRGRNYSKVRGELNES